MPHLNPPIHHFHHKTSHQKILARRRTTAGVSSISWSAYAVTSVFWIAYGVAHAERPVVVISSLSIVLQLSVFAGTLVYA